MEYHDLEMQSDYDLGVQFAEATKINGVPTPLTPNKFAEQFQYHIDLDRFDYDAGEAGVYVSTIAAMQGFLDAGGVIAWDTINRKVSPAPRMHDCFICGDKKPY